LPGALGLQALRGERFILFPRPHAPGYYDALVAICRQVGLEPTIRQETKRLHTALSLVAGGRGVSLMPKCVERLRRPGVVCRALLPPVPETAMGIAYNPANQSRLLRGFVSVVDKVFATDH
jgi:DNA-binding transcriptional LysR family regulator